MEKFCAYKQHYVDISNFNKNTYYCKQCASEYKKQLAIKNRKTPLKNVKQNIVAQNKQEYDKQYNDINKEKIKIRSKNYYLNNKEKIIEKNRKYSQIKRKIDINYKLKLKLSHSIRQAILNNNSKKHGSIKDYLPYTIQQLKAYLESLFESWMNWNNYGSYKVSTWNDNDSSTWTWQIDHIVPHANFKYASMEDLAFKECWALSNLRPYSSKQNLLDGITRIRHKV